MSRSLREEEREDVQDGLIESTRNYERFADHNCVERLEQALAKLEEEK